jgi:thiol:disulfide interchange protein
MPLIFSMLLGLSSTVIAKTKATATAVSGATPAQDLLPAEDVFKVSARFKDAKTIELTYQIADGYYLYRKRFSVANETPQFKLGKLVSPAGRVTKDANFVSKPIARVCEYSCPSPARIRMRVRIRGLVLLPELPALPLPRVLPMLIRVTVQ